MSVVLPSYRRWHCCVEEEEDNPDYRQGERLKAINTHTQTQKNIN